MAITFRWSHFQPDTVRVFSTESPEVWSQESLSSWGQEPQEDESGNVVEVSLDAPYVLFTWCDDSGQVLLEGNSAADLVAQFADMVRNEWEAGDISDEEALAIIKDSQVDKDSNYAYAIIRVEGLPPSEGDEPCQVFGPGDIDE